MKILCTFMTLFEHVQTYVPSVWPICIYPVPNPSMSFVCVCACRTFAERMPNAHRCGSSTQVSTVAQSLPYHQRTCRFHPPSVKQVSNQAGQRECTYVCMYVCNVM